MDKKLLKIRVPSGAIYRRPKQLRQHPRDAVLVVGGSYPLPKRSKSPPSPGALAQETILLQSLKFSETLEIPRWCAPRIARRPGSE
ncbi:MAG: hypothetical protein U9R05_09280 [Chloroflexota bacterium]|nr:hypothetical protein [Chloroflexota bacterium]